jgi:prevent-host-death family protein
VNIHEAKAQLSRLVKRAADGEEIVIARCGKPPAKIVAFRRPSLPESLEVPRDSWQSSRRSIRPCRNGCWRSSNVEGWIADDPELSRRARVLIGSSANEVLVSAATTWEIAIKAALGRDLNGFTPLAVSVEHALRILDLPAIHRDPFGRLLAAQCLAERTTFVSRDQVFERYGVTVRW